MASTQVLAGFHAVIARLRQAPESVREIYVESNRRDKRMLGLIEQATQLGRPVHPVNADRLSGLSGGSRHQGVVAIADTRSLAHDLDEVLDGIEGPALLLVLDGITDPHNLGACLRTADAAGVHAVIAPRDRAAGLSTVAQRVACGAAESVPYIMVTNLARTMRMLQEENIWIVGTAGEADHTLYQSKMTGRLALVMGAEGEGMRRLTREHCDELISIPMAGSVSSLNVSVATGICLFEAVRQRG